MSANNEDGYIKYQNNWKEHPPIVSPEQLVILNNCRTKLKSYSLIGSDSNGIGFGNISIRYEKNDFIISGSATGHLEELSENHFTLVTGFNISDNSIETIGPVQASSEAMSHAALYAVSPLVKAVIHIHNREFWNAHINKLPTTNSLAEYGTPAIAEELARIANLLLNTPNKIIIMGGHQDGIIAFGESLEEISSELIHLI